MKPEDDGITHINVYSKGRTGLGRFLSNFAYAPIDTEDGPFDSIEGYWYWLRTGDERLRSLSGYAAKRLGRQLSSEPDIVNDDDREGFRSKICTAIRIKLEKYVSWLAELCSTKLPLKHYYVYDHKVHTPKGFDWIIDCIEDIRTERAAK